VIAGLATLFFAVEKSARRGSLPTVRAASRRRPRSGADTRDSADSHRRQQRRARESGQEWESERLIQAFFGMFLPWTKLGKVK
jgi:hypothetical protein